MNELMLFSALSAQRTEAALLRGNAVTERFGLTLTPEQCGRLLARRAEALRETERFEPGEGILPKLAVALCDSPCVGPENWEEALGGLTELFYHFKGACGERLGDDELLRGVLFFLAVPEKPDGGGEAERADRIRVLLPLDLADELARGQRRAQRDAALTIALWRKVVETLPPLENRSLRDTLRSIGRGFRCYDTRFFPQRFDCDIDYQLAVPVSESLLGINYVNRYLTDLAAENILLTRLPQGEVRAVLERSCPDWRGLLVNLYAPVAANALARTLLGGEGLTLSDGEIGALRERWEHARPERIMADLLAAADALAERLALPRGAGKYLSGFAREVAARAEALRDCGGLRGVFV